MHHSSYLKAELFADTYFPKGAGQSGPAKILELGAKSYHAQDTFRGCFEDERFHYTGLDIEEGANVDIVPRNLFVWNEIEDNTFDACVSGQMFEHNPFFWVTFAEMIRVLKPGGLAFVVAPASGEVHRYPIDAWRFYPDAWPSLASMTGAELRESFVESERTSVRISGGHWRDSTGIFAKPEIAGEELADFNARLRELNRVYQRETVSVEPADPLSGKWVLAYEEKLNKDYRPKIRHWLRKLVAGKWTRMF